MAKQRAKPIDLGAEHIQPALKLLGQFRWALEDGRPLSWQLAFVDELADTLISLEDAVGVVTPPKSFD
jgi:hypothetical protein